MSRVPGKGPINQYPHVTTADEVAVPGWADEYDVGDLIRFRQPLEEVVREEVVVGFSTLDGDRGKPCIEVPEYLKLGVRDKTETLSIDEKYHVPRGDGDRDE